MAKRRNLKYIFLCIIIQSLFLTSALAADEFKFISAVKDDNGKWKYDSSPYIPHLVGRAAYGWALPVAGDKARKATVTIIAPEKVKTWPKGSSVTPDRKKAHFTMSLTPKNNHIFALYTIATGDPLGHYQMTVSAENKLYTIDFEILEESSAIKKNIYLNIGRMKNMRQEILGFNTACFEQGWGWDPKLSLLTNQEFLLQAEQIIARHQQRLTHYQLCHEKLRLQFNSYKKIINTLSDEATIAKLKDDKISDDLKQIMKLVQISSQRMENTIKDIYPQIISLEQSEIEYIRQLRDSIKKNPETSIIQSPKLEQSESAIMRRSRQDAVYAQEEVELIHSLWPTKKSYARVNNSKISVALYKAIDNVYQQDFRDDVQKVKEMRQDLTLVSFMVYQATTNEDIKNSFPIARDEYIAILENMKQLDKYLEVIIKLQEVNWNDADMSNSDVKELRKRLIDMVNEMDNATRNIEQKLQYLDKYFSQS